MGLAGGIHAQAKKRPIMIVADMRRRVCHLHIRKILATADKHAPAQERGMRVGQTARSVLFNPNVVICRKFKQRQSWL